MTKPTSRKDFFAHLLGGGALLGAVPRLVAKPVSPESNSARRDTRRLGSLEVRVEPRAVIRRADTV